MFYQVQFQEVEISKDDWKPFGKAVAKREVANARFLDLVSQNAAGLAKLKAVRIVTVVKHSDNVWRVKDILIFRDFPRPP